MRVFLTDFGRAPPDWSDPATAERILDDARRALAERAAAAPGAR